jgi:hypothetical protein
MPIFRMIAYGIAKTFSKIFGLATITFFGRMPSRDDDKVAAAGMLSLFWLFTIPAVFIPEFAEIVFPFLPDDEALLRGLSVVTVVLLPPVIGFIITRLHNRRHEGNGTAAAHLLYGYGYATVISLLVLGLVLIVPVVKVSYILRRFDLKHIAIMVGDDDEYEALCRQVVDLLERHGIEAEPSDPQRVIGWLFTGLTWVEGRIFRREITPRMTVLKGHVDGEDRWFEIRLHGTDISIIGKQAETSLLYAIIGEELDLEHVCFSWDDESQDLERRIRERQHAADAGEPTDSETLDEMCAELRELELSNEEWNAIRRQLYRLECASLRLREPEEVAAG